MKILYHHRIRSRDGQSVHLEELIGALRDLGHEVVLVGPNAFVRVSLGHEPALLGVVKKFAPKSLYELLELAYNVPAFFRLFRACGKHRPDFVYERSNLYLLAGLWCGRAARVPVVLEVNAPLARERTKFGGLAFPDLARKLELWTWRSADLVLPVSEALADEIRSGGTPTERIAIVPNAIDPEKFTVAEDGRAKLELQLSGKIVIGFTGFVRDWHGLDSVISMLARPGIPSDLHLLVVGEGPALDDLKMQCRILAVAHKVTFAGLVERDRIARHVAAFDIAILPRCVDYCSPLKLFEYMAAGKAIVAPDQPNIREILESETSALLFQPDTPGSLDSALLHLAVDGDLRDRLGLRARALIDSRGYTWRHNAQRVSALATAAIRDAAVQSTPATK
ncbi:MAG TPA: glycosyltransferase family 4 protein [Rhizomicrobium sp.]